MGSNGCAMSSRLQLGEVQGSAGFGGVQTFQHLVWLMTRTFHAANRDDACVAMAAMVGATHAAVWLRCQQLEYQVHSVHEQLVSTRQGLHRVVQSVKGVTKRMGRVEELQQKVIHNELLILAARVAQLELRIMPPSTAAPNSHGEVTEARVGDIMHVHRKDEGRDLLRTCGMRTESARHEKRRLTVSVTKATAEYQACAARFSSQARSSSAPRTPDADDQSISKRNWEECVRIWRMKLRNFQRMSDA